MTTRPVVEVVAVAAAGSQPVTRCAAELTGERPTSWSWTGSPRIQFRSRSGTGVQDLAPPTLMPLATVQSLGAVALSRGSGTQSPTRRGPPALWRPSQLGDPTPPAPTVCVQSRARRGTSRLWVRRLDHPVHRCRLLQSSVQMGDGDADHAQLPRSACRLVRLLGLAPEGWGHVKAVSAAPRGHGPSAADRQPSASASAPTRSETARTSGPPRRRQALPPLKVWVC